MSSFLIRTFDCLRQENKGRDLSVLIILFFLIHLWRPLGRGIIYQVDSLHAYRYGKSLNFLYPHYSRNIKENQTVKRITNVPSLYFKLLLLLNDLRISLPTRISSTSKVYTREVPSFICLVDQGPCVYRQTDLKNRDEFVVSCSLRKTKREPFCLRVVPPFRLECFYVPGQLSHR